MRHHLCPNLVGGWYSKVKVFWEDRDRIFFRWSFNKNFTIYCPNIMNATISSFSISWVHQPLLYDVKFSLLYRWSLNLAAAVAYPGNKSEALMFFSLVRCLYNLVLILWLQNFAITALPQIFAFQFMWDFDVAWGYLNIQYSCYLLNGFFGWLVGVFRNSLEF